MTDDSMVRVMVRVIVRVMDRVLVRVMVRVMVRVILFASIKKRASISIVLSIFSWIVG